MDKIRIRGGRPLGGSVTVSGSKNASLPMLAACLLVDGPVVLEGVPRLADVDALLRILAGLGLAHQRLSDGSLRLEVVDDSGYEAPYHLVRQMRASFCLLGPLWARRGRAVVSYPGGCVFGHRPVDLHLKGMRALGAKLEQRQGNVHAQGPVLGGQVYLGGPSGSSVLGTANVLMAAVLARGESVIDCAAQEPEIVDLCEFLNACGARISGVGTHRLVVRGVDRLEGCRWRVIPDRIEAGTLLLAGYITRSEVEVLGARPDHLAALVDRLRAAGAPIEVGERELGEGEASSLDSPESPFVVRQVRPRRRKRAQRLEAFDRPILAVRRAASGETLESPAAPTLPFLRSLPYEQLESVDLATMPYPGFPTDLQAQFLALMCTAEGVSVVTEKIYPERFIHVSELARLGARIRREGPSAIVEGGQELSGATVMASDLRGSAALVLAGLVASGTTEIRRIYHLDRGYEGLEGKLQKLGAAIDRVAEV